MKIMLRRISSLLLATAMISTVLTTGAKANAASKSADFTLRYYSSAPSDVNILSATRTIAAAGKDRVYAKSNSFNCLISGGSAYLKCTNYDSTGASIVKANQSKELIFKGTTVPKAGVSVTISIKLKDYATSQSLSCAGKVSNSKL